MGDWASGHAVLNWTGEVYGFHGDYVEELLSCVWNTYGDEILESRVLLMNRGYMWNDRKG